jgi:TorA maturation chaperone TorD
LLSLSQKLVFFTRHLHNWLLSLLTNVEIDARVSFLFFLL